MNAAKKNIPEHNPESYSPHSRPLILNEAETAKNMINSYKGINYKMEFISLKESLKFIGVPNKGYGPFENIGVYHEKYKPILQNITQPYTEVAMYTNLPDDTRWDYIFGAQVENLDEVPDGMVGINTYCKNFAVITFYANSVYELVGGSDGPGDAMKLAGEYINEIWLPQNKDIVITDEKGECGKIIKNGKTYHTGCIEVYKKENLDRHPEMCFYIPLKGNAEIGTVSKIISEHVPESYSPKQKPEIINLTEHMKMTGKASDSFATDIEAQPRIFARDNLFIVGISGNGNETGLLWQKFMELDKSMPLQNKISGDGYEVRIYSEDGQCRCHVGVCVKGNSIPDGYELITIPSSMYAAFDVYPAQGYQSRNEEMDRWLKINTDMYEQVRLGDKYYSMLLYGHRYKGEKDPESIVEIDIPIAKRI